MGQYQTGTANVTNDSQTVTGNGTSWVANVAVGNVFKRQNENTSYEVGAVMSDTEITLTANYAGVTGSLLNYQIVSDFTPNFSLPEIHVGDKDWPYHLTQALRLIDQRFYFLVEKF